MLTVILAGGQSRRMGQDKVTLPFEGKSLLQVLIDRYRALGEVAVCVDRPGRFSFQGALELVDTFPGQGPLNGIVSGFRQTDAEELLLTAADIPFGDAALARRLQALRGTADACVIRFAGGTEPLFAVYGRSCLSVAETNLDAGERSMQALLRSATVQYLSEVIFPGFALNRTLFNMNTPEDYKLVIREGV